MLYVVESTPTVDARGGDGSTLIPYRVALALPPTVDVEIVAFAGPSRPDAALGTRAESIHELPERGKRDAQLLALVGRESFGTALRMTSRSRRLVRDRSRSADVTLVHGPHLLPMLDAVVGPCAYQTVDPWSFRLEEEARAATWARRLYRRQLASARAARERAIPARVELATVGRGDADRWARLLGREVTAVANGVTVDAPTGAVTRARPAHPTICFTGSLDYAPNIDAATRLVRDVGPALWAQVPDARIVIAGRHPVAAVLALRSERVQVLADVPSMAAVYAASDLAVFPDKTGLGVRNSVTEALAAGTPVVASAVAAREQPAHELLTVAAGGDHADSVGRAGSFDELGELTALAIRELRRARTTERTAPPTAGLRTWADAAGDYLALLERASR